MSTLSMMEQKTPKVLIVDDEEVNLEILSEYLEEENYEVEMAEDGDIAWKILQDHGEEFDVVLLDRMMPNMNGIEVLNHMKADPRFEHIPVIFQTAMAGDKAAQEGLSAGAYYYLSKPYDEDMMLTIVKTAVNDHRQYKMLQSSLDKGTRSMLLMQDAEFHYKTLDDARNLSAFLAQACPNPDRAVFGLGELLVNAVEHGNLAITYDEKSKLMADNEWRQEIERRLEDPAYKDRRVRIKFHREPTKLIINIKDEGSGFDWQKYETIDPQRAMHTHGRGIAMSKVMSFSEMHYKGDGSEVECIFYIEPAEAPAGDATSETAAA